MMEKELFNKKKRIYIAPWSVAIRMDNKQFFCVTSIELQGPGSTEEEWDEDNELETPYETVVTL